MAHIAAHRSKSKTNHKISVRFGFFAGFLISNAQYNTAERERKGDQAPAAVPLCYNLYSICFIFAVYGEYFSVFMYYNSAIKRKESFSMDMKKIGTFLAELRKKSNLTQDELGEKIGVTNKTVSRWENGNYLPPVEMLQILSKLYDVSINEILNGERISESEYKNISEKNIKSALNKSNTVIEKHRKIMNWIIAIVVAILYVMTSLISQKWEYTWIIWIVYCVYRIVETIVLHYLNVQINSSIIHVPKTKKSRKE